MRWLTVFAGMEPIHLNKDVALLPKGVASCDGVKGVVLVTDSRQQLDSAGKVRLVTGQNICRFIFSNGREFEVIHLFHLKWSTCFYALIFRIVNPNALVYIKLDAGPDIKAQVSSKGKTFRKPRVPDLIYAIANKLSVETRESYEFLLAQGWSKQKLFLLPNGIDTELLKIAASKRNEIKCPRNRTILTVGRLGTFQKNTESLIRAYGFLPAFIRQEWVLELVGPVEPNVKEALEILASAACQESGTIIFTGPIQDRGQLYDLYARSMVFAFPSRFEGSALVLFEAIAFGLYIVSTPVGSAPDLVTSPEIGLLSKPEDDEDLAKQLTTAISYLAQSPMIESKIDKNLFSWESLAAKLCAEINA